MWTWADDLRRLCDALGLRKPVVLGSSFGGFVALSYAALFPDHPGGVILASTTGGHQTSSGSSRHSAASAARRRPPSPSAPTLMRPETIKLSSSASATRFTAARRAGPRNPAFPGPDDQEHGRRLALLHSRGPRLRPLERDRRRHVSRAGPGRRGRPRLPAARGRGTSQPAASGNHPPGAPSRARHTIFRDRPDLAFPAVRHFVSQIREASLGKLLTHRDHDRSAQMPDYPVRPHPSAPSSGCRWSRNSRRVGVRSGRGPHVDRSCTRDSPPVSAGSAGSCSSSRMQEFCPVSILRSRAGQGGGLGVPVGGRGGVGGRWLGSEQGGASGS